MPSTPAAAASALLVLVAIALWAWRAAGRVVPGGELATWQVMALEPALAYGVGAGAATLICVVAALLRRRAPWLGITTWLGSAVLLATMGAAAATRGWWALVAVLLVCVPLLGGLLGAAFSRRGRTRGRVESTAGGERIGRFGLLAGIAAAVVLLLTAAFLVWPGAGPAPATSPSPAGSNADGSAQAAVARGPHEVRTLRYGTGRPGPSAGYGPGVPVVTQPVDASAVITGWPPEMTQAWGFDPSAVPLNGTVWMPAEAGRFPLVLLVHGSSTVPDSEAGLAYLGEHLASRGYVAAAIDENFLNPGVLGPAVGGLDAARSWLVLAHLRQWSAWAGQTNGPFAGRVDVERVGLVGHSRGGEAVATAAALNAAGTWPDDPAAAIDTGATVRTVVAIAPSDGLYQPAGQPVRLRGIDYLTLAGSYDADVMTFAGARQFARTEPGPGRRKTAVLLDAANHSQFNTRWGRYDGALGAARGVLATAPLLEPEQQQALATAYVGAFLDLGVQGRDANARYVEEADVAPWSPRVAVRHQVARGDGTDIAGPGVASGTPATAQRTVLPSRTGSGDVPVLNVAAGARLEVPRERLTTVTEAARLTLDLATANTANTATRDEQLTLEAADASGRTARVPLRLPPPLPGQFTKLAAFLPVPATEPTLSTVSVRLSDLGLDLATLRRATLVVPPEATDGVYVGPVRLITADRDTSRRP
ncbi:poly(ethylene terephthalate) hydrolase family protein [Piscicoccus intestinalis]|uniref:poly(ethylene terephthalate) hydrolase family protein n=1 Tax=Piscicoccus intestinalis TaxID=746033 RepID=UPI0012ED071C|nr:hypothetical protein [Piscicoccus intestinalis]